jgi:GGDEF domain-containing protein
MSSSSRSEDAAKNTFLFTALLYLENFKAFNDTYGYLRVTSACKKSLSY